MKILWIVFLRMFIATFLGLATLSALSGLVLYMELSQPVAGVIFLSVPLTPYIFGIRYIVGAKKKYGSYFEIKNKNGEFIKGQNAVTRMLALIGVLLVAGFLSSVLFATAFFTLVPMRQPHGGRPYNDGAIQRDLSTIRTQAEIYYGGDGGDTYGTPASTCSMGMFVADQTIAKAIARADALNEAGTVVCNSSKTEYAVSAQMTEDTNTYWCIDSTGTDQKRGEKLGSSTVCPPEKYVRQEPDGFSLFRRWLAGIPSLSDTVVGSFQIVVGVNWYLLSGGWLADYM